MVRTQRSAYGLALGACLGCHQHFGALRAEYVVEPTAERPVTVADEEAHRPALLAEHRERVAGLLGDPGGVGVGGHPGQVDPTGAQFDEEPHIQPGAARRCRR